MMAMKHPKDTDTFKLLLEKAIYQIVVLVPYGFEAWGKISKSEMQAIEKSVIKEIITATSNIFNWIANGDRYMASKGEN